MTVKADFQLPPEAPSPVRTWTGYDRGRAFRAARRHSLLVRFLRFLLPILALAVVSAYFFSSSISVTFDGKKLSTDGIDVSAKKIKMVNPRLAGFSKNSGKYTVTAKSASQNIDDPFVIALDDITANIENADKGAAQVKARSGVFYSKREFLTLSGDIKVTSNQGMTARLETADINMKTQTITSKQPVAIDAQGSTVRANTMTFNTESREIDFAGNIKVRIHESRQANTPAKQGQSGISSISIDRSKPINIVSARLKVFDRMHLAHFMGGAVATQDTYRLSSENLKVYYSGSAATGPASAAANIRLIEASNNVRIDAENDQNATSERLSFDVKLETITMSGNVVLIQGKNVLKGNEFLVEMKSGKARFKPGGRVHGQFVNEQTASDGQIAATKADPKPRARKVPLRFDVSSTRGKPILIAADSLILDEKAGKGTFIGDVVTNQGGYELKSSNLTFYYSATPNQTQAVGQNTNISKIKARDKVLITTPDNQSIRSDWADFDVTKNKIVIGGNVMLSRAGDILKGNRLKIDLNTGRSQLEWGQAEDISGEKGRVRALIVPRQIKPADDKKKTNSAWPTEGKKAQP